MKKNILFSMCTGLLFLVSCDYNRDNFPGYDDLTHATDVQNVTITIEDAEYKTIAGIAANKELALSKDPEDKTYANALEAVGKNKFFTEDAPAAWYLPAYINDKYPYLSDGSKATVHYNNFENLPKYLKDFNGVSTYTLTADDYKTVWGETVSAPFLSPSTRRQIPDILKKALANPADSAMYLVNYAYAETEPIASGGTANRNSSDMTTTRASAPTPNASAVYRYYATTAKWEAYTSASAKIALLQPDDYTAMGSTYVSKPSETLPIYLKQNYPYAKKNAVMAVVYYADKKLKIAATEFIYDGANWIQTTVSTPSVIVFLKSQSVWTEAKVYYSSSFLNGEDGGFVVQDIELSGLKSIWQLDKDHGWKGSGYSESNKETESWLVSPEISLKKSAAPALKFDIAINYLKDGELTNYFNVMISTDYDGDVTKAKWTELAVNGLPKGNSWDFSTVTPVDLSAYKDQNIRIAFRYRSDVTAATTTEIKNMSIQE